MIDDDHVVGFIPPEEAEKNCGGLFVRYSHLNKGIQSLICNGPKVGRHPGHGSLVQNPNRIHIGSSSREECLPTEHDFYESTRWFKNYLYCARCGCRR